MQADAYDKVKVEKAVPLGLHLEVIDTPPPEPGQPLNCAVRAHNDGSAALFAVRVRAALPAGLRLAAAEPAEAAREGAVVWELETLAPGATAELRLQLAPVGDTRLGDVPPLGFAVSYSLAVPLVRPNLVAAVKAPEHVPIGQPVALRVRVANTGNAPAERVELRARLSSGLRHPAGSVVAARLGNLLPGGSRKVLLEATAAEAGPQTVEVLAVTRTARGETQCEIVVTEPVLRLNLLAPPELVTGREAEFTAEVTNTGTADAAGVRLIFAMPEGCTVGDIDGGEANAAWMLVHWDLGTIPAGEMRRRTFRLSRGEAGDVELRAAVQAEGDRKATAELAVRWEQQVVEIEVPSEEPVAAPVEPIQEPVQAPTAQEPVAAPPPQIQAPKAVAAPSLPPPNLEELAFLPQVGETERVVAFTLGGTEFALPLACVQEIALPLPTTPVPDAPGWMLGVAEVNGGNLPMIDLGRFFGLGEGNQEEDRRLLVVGHAGMMVDRITGVFALSAEPSAEAGPTVAQRVMPYLRGVAEAGGRCLPILDPDLLLEAPEMQPLP
jgi:chemotaxis signal transduction protein